MHGSEAQAWSKRFAKELLGPLGTKPLLRAFMQNLDGFEALRSSGATWPQIGRLLSSAGVVGKRGQFLEPAQIRATFAEAKRRARGQILAGIPKQLKLEQYPDAQATAIAKRVPPLPSIQSTTPAVTSRTSVDQIRARLARVNKLREN